MSSLLSQVIQHRPSAGLPGHILVDYTEPPCITMAGRLMISAGFIRLLRIKMKPEEKRNKIRGQRRAAPAKHGTGFSPGGEYQTAAAAARRS